MANTAHEDKHFPVIQAAFRVPVAVKGALLKIGRGASQRRAAGVAGHFAQR
jgi:hypothetical protein